MLLLDVTVLTERKIVNVFARDPEPVDVPGLVTFSAALVSIVAFADKRCRMLLSMAVMTREKWTDERLDDLAGLVDRGFAEVKGEIRDLRTEVNGSFDSVNGRFDSFQAEMNSRFDSFQTEMNSRFDSFQTEMNSRFDSMQRTMVIGFASIVASVVGAVVAGLALG